MYIFNRSTTVDRNRQLEATEAAVEVAALVGGITGIPVNVFITRYGAPVNTIAWSCRVDSQAQLEAATDKLVGNDDYMKWVMTHGELFATAAEDRLSAVVSSSLAPTPAKFYTMLVASAANGMLADAIAFGVRAQQFVNAATGLPTAFLNAVYGPFGTVGWLTGADSAADLDRLQEMQTTNSDYHALVAEAGPLFTPGSGLASLIEKVN